MRAWGRIFFRYDDKKELKQVFGQPLENHTGNCRIIIEHLEDRFFNHATKQRLLEAAIDHDLGKRQKFRIYSDVSKTAKQSNSANKGKNKPKEIKELVSVPDHKDSKPIFSYSFSGHRFIVQNKDAYIDALIRSHHEFSVEQINRERSKFPPDSEEKQSFADDLYLLCMADQIEAELAVKTFEHKADEEVIPRTFMEFATERVSDDPLIYTVIPWHFANDSFSLSFELKELRLNALKPLDAAGIEKALKEGIEITESKPISVILQRG